MDTKPAHRVLARRLSCLGLPIHASPPPHDPFDMYGGASSPNLEQLRFRLRRSDAGQCSDLGVGKLAVGQSLSQERPIRSSSAMCFGVGISIGPMSDE